MNRTALVCSFWNEHAVFVDKITVAEDNADSVNIDGNAFSGILNIIPNKLL